jgi:hypothetical protein
MSVVTFLGWSAAVLFAIEWWVTRALLKIEKDFAQSMKQHALDALEREKGLIEYMRGITAVTSRRRPEREKPN